MVVFAVVHASLVFVVVVVVLVVAVVFVVVVVVVVSRIRRRVSRSVRSMVSMSRGHMCRGRSRLGVRRMCSRLRPIISRSVRRVRRIRGSRRRILFAAGL